MKYKFLASAIVGDASLGERQIRVIANSGNTDRVGDVLVAAGCKLDNFRKNPIVLNGHDPTKPIGTAGVYIVGERLEAVITFAPAGASREADEVCALAKAGILGAVSVGFRQIESEPIRGGRGERFTSWELCELSVVAVPCDPDAVVIARSLSKSGRVLNARNAASVAALVRCLDKSAEAHDDACDMLDKSALHREKARRHAARIAASATGDSGDADDDPEDDPGDDPDDDVELAASAERRKRLIEIAGRALPDHRSADEQRRKRLIEIAALAQSA